MATSFLLESKIKWNPLLPTTSPNRRFPTFFSIKLCTQTPRIPKPSASNLRLNCTFMNNGKYPLNSAVTEEKDEIVISPFETVARTIMEVLKALKKPAITGVLFLFLLLLWNRSNSALASSGGVMGGDDFSSWSESYDSGGGEDDDGSSYYVGDGGEVSVKEFLYFILFVMAAFAIYSVFKSPVETSVLKLQVGLLGTARSLQHDLNRIAVTADTSNSNGFSNVLTKTVLALRRHPDYCISGYSSVDVKQNMNEGEELFKRLSTEERRKFDEETLVNVNNIRKQTSSSQRANGTSNEYIVITILVAAKGVHKLPTINGSGDLKEALQKLGSIPASETLAVQVLWTPQIENDTLTERELLEDYPLLRPLQKNSTL